MIGKISNVAARILILAWYRDGEDWDEKDLEEIISDHTKAPKVGDRFDLGMGAELLRREDGWYVQELEPLPWPASKWEKEVGERYPAKLCLDLHV
jgi:hypothetical protein